VPRPSAGRAPARARRPRARAGSLASSSQPISYHSSADSRRSVSAAGVASPAGAPGSATRVATGARSARVAFRRRPEAGRSAARSTSSLVSKFKSTCPESGRQLLAPSVATISSPSACTVMLVSGSAASCWLSEAHMLRIRRMGTPASTRPRVVRSSSRSWKPNDSGPIGPRCGARNPARANARSRAAGSSRMRAVSLSENRRPASGSMRVIPVPASMELSVSACRPRPSWEPPRPPSRVPSRPASSPCRLMSRRRRTSRPRCHAYRGSA